LSTPPAPPNTYLPAWGVADLPAAIPLGWRHLTSFIGPGIVMMGFQIGGGEWLFGPEITARYGGGLMWVATLAIVLQVFYNLECGRYALYCGEPIFTGFLRTWPGPRFWIPVFWLYCTGMLIPGLSTQGAAIIAALILGRPATAEDGPLVMGIAYACLIVVVLPVFVGGKVYNTLQAILTTKVVLVLSFCAAVSFFLVDGASWWNVGSGFFKFGTVPVADGTGGETLVNVFDHFLREGAWPAVALANIAILGGFAGYAGGGGLGNSIYSNYVRDKGWGMGSLVGAIPSAIGGKHITLSHIGKAFPITAANLERWQGWWRHILVDQVLIWMPGCFAGMALPALISMQFAPHSEIYHQTERFDWAQPVIAADGMRHAPGFSPGTAHFFWVAMLIVGMLVLLPSQLSIVDDMCRRWTDILWSGSRTVRRRLESHQVKWIYYGILASYVLWSLAILFVFDQLYNPKGMVLVISNLNNLTLGLTSFHLLYINLRFLPREVRPRWYQSAGLAACGTFNLALMALVFFAKVLPGLQKLWE
jgi:hypothetical protein